MCSWKHFLPPCNLSLPSTDCVLLCAEGFYLITSHLSAFEVISTRDLFRKTLPMSISWNIFLIFFSCSSKTLKYLIYFQWFFLYRIRDTALVSFFYLWLSSLASSICWRSCLFIQMYIFENFVENWMAIPIGYISGSWSACLFFCAGTTPL